MNLDQRIAEWINQNRLRGLDGFFIFITDSASIIAYSIPILALIYAFIKNNKPIKIKGFQILSSLLLSTLLVTILKNLIKRQRPYEIDKLIEKLSVGGGFSFPSGHTADAFVVLFSVSLLLSRKRILLVPMLLWALMVAYSRMLLGVHYITDVT